MERVERVASFIRREISIIIQTELNDPRLQFVTITDIKLTKDLRSARLFYSVLGEAKQKQKAARALKVATGFMRKLIGQRMRLRLVPELTFTLDESTEYGLKIDKIFEEIKESEKTDVKESKKARKKQ